MLVLIKHILEKTGKQSLEEIWPNLEVFFHGGVAFTPYREQYKDVIRSSKMHYVETYNASEGYFGTQNDPADPAMLLMIDYGIFYEFIPLEDVGKENPRTFCLEEVELNKNYAMVISTSAAELYEWTRRLHLMRKWAEMLNKLGGDVTVIHLPDVGLHGNTHFPMSDLNNVEVADLLSKWLYEKQLDR